MSNARTNDPSKRPVALITGGGTGVGAATSIALARSGYNIAVNYSRSGDEAQQTAAACRNEDVDAFALKGNVASDTECKAMATEVVSRWGRIDALVNSAGTTQFTVLSDLDNQNAEDFQRIYGVNVIGAYQMSRAAAPHLQENGSGTIINVSSIAGPTGNGSSLAYIASKGALNSLTLALARLLAPNVRVNAVLPGLIDTRWFLQGVDAERFDAIKEGYAASAALESVCTAEDIAETILYLCAGARAVTGQLLVVDAGSMLGRAAKLSK